MADDRLDGPYSLSTEGIYCPSFPVAHRHEEFNEAQLDIYAEIESRHFWFAGRRRYLTHAVRWAVCEFFPSARNLRAIDLGAGTGGWAAHLTATLPETFAEVAIADSSPRALTLAASTIGPSVARYHTDLRRLEWSNRWDVAFLLDVLEHIADDEHVLGEVARALRPGGLIFVTTPAFEALRSYNDDIEHHVRRYTRRDLQRLAEASGLDIVDSRYFMFLLGPFLVASRIFGPKVDRLTRDERLAIYRRTHQVPFAPVNAVLRAIFNLETPLGHWLRFKWGTSLLGVFRKPN